MLRPRSPALDDDSVDDGLLEAIRQRDPEVVGRVVLQIVPEPDRRHARDERVQGIRPPVGLLKRLEGSPTSS